MGFDLCAGLVLSFLAGSEFSAGFDLFPCCSGLAEVEAVI